MANENKTFVQVENNGVTHTIRRSDLPRYIKMGYKALDGSKIDPVRELKDLRAKVETCDATVKAAQTKAQKQIDAAIADCNQKIATADQARAEAESKLAAAETALADAAKQKTADDAKIAELTAKLGAGK